MSTHTYPEHDRLQNLKPEKPNEVIDRFLDHLAERGVCLAHWNGENGQLFPLMETRSRIVGRFVDVDPDILSAEKDLIVARVQRDERAIARAEARLADLVSNREAT